MATITDVFTFSSIVKIGLSIPISDAQFFPCPVVTCYFLVILFWSIHFLEFFPFLSISKTFFFVWHPDMLLSSPKETQQLQKQHQLWKSAALKRIKLHFPDWSHFKDLKEGFKMGPIWGLQLYSFRSNTLPKLMLFLKLLRFFRRRQQSSLQSLLSYYVGP